MEDPDFKKVTSEWMGVIGNAVKVLSQNQDELSSILEENIDNTEYNYNKIHELKWEIKVIKRDINEIKLTLNLLLNNKTIRR